MFSVKVHLREQDKGLKGPVDSADKPCFSSPRKALGEAAANESSFSAFRPLPREPLPALSILAVPAEMTLISLDGLPSILHDTPYRRYIRRVNSSLLVSWSNLETPHTPATGPSTAAESPNSLTFSTEDSSFVDPDLPATWSDFGYLSSPSCATLYASDPSPSMPGACMSTLTRTPSRGVGTSFSSMPVSRSSAARPSPTQSFHPPLALSSPTGFRLTAALVIDGSPHVSRWSAVSKTGGTPVGRDWKCVQTLQPPRQVSGGIIKVRTLKVYNKGDRLGFQSC
ncbi:hypothetical protein GYMLUDRAFT_245959 [Collybiopsis luxurians FD-317 M1]|uniref:Uncharacterized protein n=1 Tax=Collybiopsis luxurians FD-317 M1 TaxID=944289 RepID=A0A0D0CJJ9_9AGAR|nr:hypothetical protein GYMLUDRAFT_245959 [Collybiopsis luxurians FD-317 M1]